MKKKEVSNLMSWYFENGPEGDVVVSTRIRFARNIAGHKFNSVATKEDAEKVLDIFKKLKEAANTDGSEEDKAEKATNSKQFVDMTKMFEFKNLDDVCRLANVIYNYYEGDNDLYKDAKNNRFYLMLHKSNHSPVEFNKICNRISEYALQKNYTPAIGAYYSEHGNLILSKHAIQTLASL